MAHQRTLEKSKYRNWVRGGLAYKYLKEGIEEFVDDVVQQEHSRILNVVNHSHGITCNQCCFRNLQTMHKCHQDPATGRNQCPWGQLKCNCLYPKKKHCPNKICGEIMEEILKCHGSTPPAPNWKNTEMQKWCESPWEIAKCFINAPGYSDKTRASAFDTVGLLHLLINNISLHAHLSSSLIGSDLLNKTLQRRNKLVHSASMEMEDEDLNGCIDDIIAILEDDKELKARHEAQQAVCKLMQLKKENFIITTHNEVEVCRAALQSITKKSKELTQTIQDAKDDISQKTAEATRNIDEKTRKAVQGALEDLTNHTGTLYERVGHVESEIATIKKQLAEKVGTKDELDDIRDHHQKQLKYVQAKHALQDNLVKLYQKHYVKTSISPLKLQENDVNIEEVYVSPEMAVQVNMQHQHKASTSKCCTVSTSEWKTIHRYRDIFQTNDKRHKNIYILGDVGAGKSSFCKMMIQNWCKTITGDSCNYNDNDNTQGHFVTSNMFTDTSVSDTVTTNVLFQEHSVSDIFSNTDERDITDYYRNGFSASTNYVYDYNVISNSSGKNREPRVSDASDIHDDISESETNLTEWSVKPTPGSEFDSDYQYSVDPFLDENNADIQEMRNFDFLFFIPLRSMSGLTSDVTEMIKVIATDADLASDDLIDRIIEQESERCLIIIDGLDEWNPPEDTPIFPHVSFGIPKGDRAKHSTFITLSRGSAKGILNLKSTECDQKIKLQGVNSKSVQYFTDKYMSKLNKADVCSKNFIKKAANFRRGHLERTPLLLQQLVWMYYTGNEIGNSVSDSYSHLVNIMLSWSQNKDVKVLGDYDIGVPDKYKDLQLPKLLNRFSSCEVKKQSLFLLGQVALEVLTSNMNTSTLGRLNLQKKGMSNADINELIQCGVLVEENSFNPIKEKTKLAFIHKSYLEFFAALYISSHYHHKKSPKVTKQRMQKETILKEVFGKCKTVADILQLSNLFKMVCGLSPSLLGELSELISTIARRDKRMIRYRNDGLILCNEEEPLHIQRLMEDCLIECESCDKIVADLLDVVIDVWTRTSLLHRIVPKYVLSLNISGRSNEEIWEWVTKLSRLQYVNIWGITLPHCYFVLFSSMLEKKSLRICTMTHVVCAQDDCDGHSADLSKQGLLERYELFDCEHVYISEVNTKCLKVMSLNDYSVSTLDFDCLVKANKLTELRIGDLVTLRCTEYNLKMNSAVQTLQVLQKLVLHCVEIKAGALSVAPGMRQLTHIELYRVTMDMETWCTFVDSLLTLQQSVLCQVDTLSGISNMDRDIFYNYIRQNKKLFEVLSEHTCYLRFRTKK